MRKLTVGAILKARGGWDAVVVWVVHAVSDGFMEKEGFYAIHKPGEGMIESSPIAHLSDGMVFDKGKSLYAPPAYDGHPADLDMTGYEL